MTTLDEAWAWYEATKASLVHYTRLAAYWDDLPADGRLGRDRVLRSVSADQISRNAKASRPPLDDLAILVLFSVFESQVREQVEGAISPEVAQLNHPVLRSAAAEAVKAIQDGSFYRVLERLKTPDRMDLVEHVNQVRRYRNWVAHGRRPGMEPAELISPRVAYERLTALLTAITSPPTGA